MKTTGRFTSMWLNCLVLVSQCPLLVVRFNHIRFHYDSTGISLQWHNG